MSSTAIAVILKRVHKIKHIQMQKVALMLIAYVSSVLWVTAQIPEIATNKKSTEQQQKEIITLINQYSQARENRDTILLKKILTTDVDQLVSTGEWRVGMTTAVEGMMKSSAASPGTRSLQVEKIQMLNAGAAVVDCRYQIQNTDGTTRKMWSTFIVIADNAKWKIRAIRNMLPAPGS